MKTTLKTLVSGYYSTSLLNNNFDSIEQAFDNSLSRDGSGPNEMLANIDMNGNRIINIAEPMNPNDAVTKAFADARYGGALYNAVEDLILEYSTNLAAREAIVQTNTDNAIASAANALISKNAAATSASQAQTAADFVTQLAAAGDIPTYEFFTDGNVGGWYGPLGFDPVVQNRCFVTLGRGADQWGGFRLSQSGDTVPSGAVNSNGLDPNGKRWIKLFDPQPASGISILVRILLATGAVPVNVPAAGSIDETRLTPGSVTTSKIVDGAVSFVKLAGSVIADQATAITGVANNVLMTPLRVAQVLAANLFMVRCWGTANIAAGVLTMADSAGLTIVRTGTGTWTCTMTTPMANTNYVINALVGFQSGQGATQGLMVAENTGFVRTTTQFQLVTSQVNFNLADPLRLQVSVVGRPA